mmetsp:Transcript_44445/g.115558  ORF Transcript_44445/g.115558 Transcript_44445/m.115558 type:complete len:82 (-) Transcript_44445:1473-1718(-)
MTDLGNIGVLQKAEELGLEGLDMTRVGGVPIPELPKFKTLCPVFDGMTAEEEAYLRTYFPFCLKSLKRKRLKKSFIRIQKK